MHTRRATSTLHVQYGAILIVDSEEEFYSEEIDKLRRDVQDEGLGTDFVLGDCALLIAGMLARIPLSPLID